MGMQFLRGSAQTPKGHAIFIARSTGNARTVYCTYCVVPPIPMSLTKYLPPLFAAQIPAEELRESQSVVNGMPIPPMLEEAGSMEYLERLAELRSDDLCDIGRISQGDEGARVQMAILACQEYGQLYSSYISSAGQLSQPSALVPEESIEAPVLDDLDAEELLIQTMSDRQKLTELGKLVGMARYAVEGHDTPLLQDTKRKMQRITNRLAEKYRGTDLVASAVNPRERGAQLAELYLSRAFKLLDEEYADIPGIERSIRELQDGSH
ncbi:MAG: hypothetical protein JO011_08515 [Ktedonobacteraceae bacterium]|nr:hypothetical protein [Ktedonobacteraceae bacterium]